MNSIFLLSEKLASGILFSSFTAIPHLILRLFTTPTQPNYLYAIATALYIHFWDEMMKPHIAHLVFFLVPVFYLIPNTAWAQESESMINGSVSHGAFGGPVVKFSSINNDLGLFVGGRGGWIINLRPDHAFVLGGGGYGLSTDVDVDNLMRVGEPVYLTLGYGGVELEYVNRTRDLIHFSVNTLIGGGGADYRNNGQSSEDGDSLFVTEPGISALLNVADFFRIGGGVSYRLISGINLDGVSDSDVSGASVVLTFKFGGF